MKTRAANNLVGCCGLYCGLCNKYQSTAPSRCLGCKIGEQHSWCSIWNCCVKKHGFETCSECSEVFKCEIFTRRQVAEWIPAADNLHQIANTGLENWLKEQKERQKLVEKLLHNYNEGRSASFYCKVCARLPLESISSAIRGSKKIFAREKVEQSDVKSKAKILKITFTESASKKEINLD